MGFRRLTAAEAARYVKDGDNIGLSGFTRQVLRKQ